MRRKLLLLLLLPLFFAACNDPGNSSPLAPAQPGSGETACQLMPSGDWGPDGSVPLHVEKAITGLEIPWGIAFLPGGDWLVTERPGRIRLVKSGQLASQPVAQVSIGETGEGGLLGIALHPQFASNRLFYVFYTTDKNGQTVNRVERFTLSQDHTQATSDRVVLDDIPAGTYHDGGRIKFGPDGMLYVGTGDARTPDLAQNPGSLNGKILRLTADGGTPSDNPASGSFIFASGVRNLEAFDWADPQTLIVADNGPTGELGLSGLDEVSFARGGSNLGWPMITGCQTRDGWVTPILSWTDAAPPGGGVVYRGSAIPEFNGNFIVGILGMDGSGGRQLQRVVFDVGTRSLVSHEVYLRGQYGRLREVVQGPDGALYVTTSNCDGRGTCPSDKDYILKITHG